MAMAAEFIAAHVRCMLDWQRAGAVAFEYGDTLRGLGRRCRRVGRV